MKYLKRFNETYQDIQDEILDIKDIFQSYADEYNIDYIEPSDFDWSTPKTYTIFQSGDLIEFISIYPNLENNQNFLSDMELFFSQLTSLGYKYNKAINTIRNSNWYAAGKIIPISDESFYL